MVAHPLVLVAPERAGFAVEAVRSGGGSVVEAGEDAEALVWWGGDASHLADVLVAQPTISWVQLPQAGIERVVATGVLADPRWSGITWTCAKGSYARPVAEHALLLALAGLRHLPERARARSWGSPAGTSLYGAKVALLGGGGIVSELLRLLAPFDVSPTVVRRSASPVAGAARTVGQDGLHEAIAGALVVFVALALTPETTGIIGEQELALMGPGSWLVNVARGRHVNTDALVQALSRGDIGAALDVTEPEPLPDGHPLWSMANCLITPHSADTPEMVRPLLALRIKENVERFGAGLPLVGTVDPATGY
ncbi:MAG TPA: D-isomer specific 2-hydroxyacid dehydrogenase family protein [Acidimicrobiales bacterium]|nr:D-isomer specific 2-hydroxyacid dehydrogenase family protein [Acidimicrobiales bacterium]